MPARTGRSLGRLVGRGLVVGALTLGFARTALAQEVTISDAARQHFTAGVAFLQDPDGARYEEAYREFQAAYAASPSWKMLGNLGLTAMKLERDGEAIQAYQKYLAEGGAQLDPDEKAQVERDLATLRASAGRLVLSSNPAGAQITDERAPVTGAPVVNRYGPLTGSLEVSVRSGHHRLTARLEGRADAVWEVDVQPQQATEHAFALVAPTAAPVDPGMPPGAPPGPRKDESSTPTGVYVGLAATGLFAAGGAVVGVLALGKNSDFKKKNDGSDPAGAKDLHDSGQTLNLVADALFGAAVVSAGITAVLFFTSSSDEPATTAHFRLTPVAGPHGAALFARQTF